MARPFTGEVNRHVSYRRADGRWVPAVITNVDSASVFDLRIGHAVGNTPQNVPRKTTVSGTNVWQPY